MKNIIFCIIALLSLFISKCVAQETFESKVKKIGITIENISKEEKAALKTELDLVNNQLERAEITKEQADEKKNKLAEARAKNIETRVAVEQLKINDLIKEKINGKLKENTNNDSHKEFTIKIFDRYRNDSIKSEPKTTSQLVFAWGYNNLVTNGAVANSDFSYNKSNFFEIGITFKKRLNESGILFLKYGISGMYNYLTATDNRYFVEAGNQTVLATFSKQLYSTDTYFKNVYAAIPVHLEFDFSDNKVIKGKKVIHSQNGFRFGIGGYVGYNTNSKQFLGYYDDNGNRITIRQKGSWNVPDWNYGVSTYIGHEDISLYLKYDLNPLFKNNDVKQNNISLGLRLDLD